jgi:glyoxylase-like metal-dependent hydrolase (beta-lactamase superfamily II)
MVGTLRHFTIERLGDGVWAALHAMDPPAPDAWAISNAGIVDLGDRTLVFDTLTATDAATELRRVAEELTGRPPSIVVYSHAHYDHTWGGSRFPEATVISSARARAAMLAEGLLEVADFRDVLADRLVLWAGAATSDDPLVRQDAPFFLPYWRGIAATLPTLELRYPDLGFEGRLEIHGRDRRVELVALERAHAAGDLFMTVPDESIAFCGDLLFIDCHPYLGDGDIGGLRQALGMLEASGADRFVPGHGPVGRTVDLGTLARYIDDVEGLAARGEEAAAMPDPYGAWALARFFPVNVEFCAGGGRQAETSTDEPSG